MAARYTAEELQHLRESPLCIKPENLPPAEDWMGPLPDQIRPSQKRASIERSMSFGNFSSDNPVRQLGGSTTEPDSSKPDPLVFGPPRTALLSSRGNKSVDIGKGTADGSLWHDSRNRKGDFDGERVPEGRLTTVRRRGDHDQDSEGWSTVKPRKSFGHDGAERFHGKMGGGIRDEKRSSRDRPDRDSPRDRQTRSFDSSAKEKDGGDGEGRPSTLPGRSRLESWHRSDGGDPPERRERLDRMKSWRDRDKPSSLADDRGLGTGKVAERRRGRDKDQRHEREPEWMDEPIEGQRESRTQQDFQKWMESMKKAKGDALAPGPTPDTTGPDKEAQATQEAEPEPEQPPVKPSPAIEVGPDKFFMAFGSGPGLDTVTQGESKDGAARAKSAGKSSRFTSFFTQVQDDGRGRPDSDSQLAALFRGPLAGENAASESSAVPAAPAEEEKQAFQQLLAKLQKQTVSATPPGRSPFASPPQDALRGPPQSPPHGFPATGAGRKNSLMPLESWQHLGAEGRDGPMLRPPPPPQAQEILAPRPQQQSARPGQLLQDLVGHHQRTSSHASGPPEMNAARNNSNTAFLMDLMRAGMDGPGPQISHGMFQGQHGPAPGQMQAHPQKKGPGQPQVGERGPEYPRDARSAGPQRQMRRLPPPLPTGFPLEEPYHAMEEREPRAHQPTMILQRPQVPPGLDQRLPGWISGGAGNGGAQSLPPQQHVGPMMPPPGLPGGPPVQTRNPPMPQMFPPNYPPGPMGPPDVMGGMPPRSGMPPPPPGFYNGPPPGFMPPNLVGYNGPPGLDPYAFPGSPFEGRGMPPPGHGRGANFNRP